MKHLCILLGFTFFVSCQSDSKNPADDKGIDEIYTNNLSSTTIEKIVNTNNSFAFDLLHTISANEEENKNIFISPLSVRIAFAMLNNGAAGKTRDEIQQTLGFGDVSTVELNTYFRSLLDSMKLADPATVFNCANAIWIDQNFPVLQTYKNVNQKVFDAEISNVLFAEAEKTALLINNWCKQHTQGMIPEIVTEKDLANLYMCLGNALYFKGNWTLPFPKEDTKEMVFNNQDGSKPEIPTMHIDTMFNFVNYGTHKLLELPYGNESFNMLLVLPSKEKSIDQFLKEWNGEGVSALHGAKVSVQLPKFKIKYERKLDDDLQAIGIKSAFSPSANFSNLTDWDVNVSKVLHKTAIEVNEEGTAASAVTLIMVDIGSSEEPQEPPTFHADRPFLFLIQEKSSNAILFMGVVRNL